jgi:glycerophosphoryl diester phosphodiesterase
MCFALVSRTYLEIIETTHHTPRIISHRGLTEGAYRATHIENTLDSFKRAIDAGVDGIETDLQILRDGTVVFFHDEKINTASGTIPVTDLTYDELIRYEVHVTSLVELSKSPIFTCDRTWFFEIKEYSKKDETVHILDTILDIAKDRDMYQCIYVGSFNLDRVYAFKSYAPKLRTNLYVYNIVRDMSDEIDGSRVDVLSIEESLLTSSFTRTFMNQGKDIYIWTVNDVSRVETAALFGVTGVITDIPIAVHASLGASGMHHSDMFSTTTLSTHSTKQQDIKIIRLFGKVFILDLSEIWDFRFTYSL